MTVTKGESNREARAWGTGYSRPSKSHSLKGNE